MMGIMVVRWSSDPCGTGNPCAIDDSDLFGIGDSVELVIAVELAIQKEIKPEDQSYEASRGVHSKPTN